MKYILTLLVCCGYSFLTNAQVFDTQAHRGGRALMPENTIPAMLNGVKLGIHTLELDTYITGDGKVVVSHNAYMSSKSTFYTKCRMTALNCLQKGVKQHPDFLTQQRVRTYKPLLADLIDSVENYVKIHRLKPVYYNIETKSKVNGDNISNPMPDVFCENTNGGC